MQVNNVQQSPNFGSSFKIAKGAESLLKGLPLSELSKMKSLCMEVENLKYVETIIGHDLVPVLRYNTGKTIKAPFEVMGQQGSSLYIKARGKNADSYINAPYVVDQLFFDTTDEATNAARKLIRLRGQDAIVQYAKYANRSAELVEIAAKPKSGIDASSNDLLQSLINYIG